jgi:hypothetical protein
MPDHEHARLVAEFLLIICPAPGCWACPYSSNETCMIQPRLFARAECLALAVERGATAAELATICGAPY